MPVVAILMVAAAVVTALGQIQASKAAQASAKYQSAVARNNQILAQRAAADATARGAQEAKQHLRQTAMLIGKQRTTLAANGVLVDTGSALDITADTAATGQLEALQIKNNAAREALGFETQGMNFQAESTLSLMKAKSEQKALPFSVGATLLGGAASAYGAAK